MRMDIRRKSRDEGAPKVSVVVPVCNVEEYLEECLESIMRQTLDDIEIICVNDGSTDNSLSILERLADDDQRICIVTKDNAGYGAAMNDGIAKATGEYIGIVESDDYVALNMFEDLYGLAKANELDFVKADFFRFTKSENGNLHLVYNKLDSTDEWYGSVFNPSEHPETLHFIMNTWSGIYRREYLIENGIRHNETPGASFQDNGFWVQTFVYAKRAMLLGRPYYMNRRDNPNSSVFDATKVFAMKAEYDYITNLLKDNESIWEKYGSMVWLMRFRNYMFSFSRISDARKREFIECINAELSEALTNGAIDTSLFSSEQLEKFRLITTDPEGFLIRYMHVPNELKDLRKENKKLKRVKQSATYRVGAAVLWLPKTIKRGVRDLLNKTNSLL